MCIEPQLVQSSKHNHVVLAFVCSICVRWTAKAVYVLLTAAACCIAAAVPTVRWVMQELAETAQPFTPVSKALTQLELGCGMRQSPSCTLKGSSPQASNLRFVTTKLHLMLHHARSLALTGGGSVHLFGPCCSFEV